MNPPGYDTNYQWNGPRDIFTRQQFAAVIRDASGIDAWYPVRYRHKKSDLLIHGFMVAESRMHDSKYGYYWVIEWETGSTKERRNKNGKIIYSDYWTACVDLAKYLGCTEQEINDIFWNGKSRDLVGCPGCPCNRVEGEGKR